MWLSWRWLLLLSVRKSVVAVVVDVAQADSLKIMHKFCNPSQSAEALML